MKRSYRPDSAPLGYVVFYRASPRGKWVEIGRAATLREAHAYLTGSGGFWLHVIREETVLPVHTPDFPGMEEITIPPHLKAY